MWGKKDILRLVMDGIVLSGRVRRIDGRVALRDCMCWCGEMIDGGDGREECLRCFIIGRDAALLRRKVYEYS